MDKILRFIYALLMLLASIIGVEGPATPTPAGPVPIVQPTPPPAVLAEDQATAEKLANTPLPGRDLAALAARLKAGAPTPAPIVQVTDRPLGSQERFWVTDQENFNHFSVTATLQYKTAHAYFYVEDGLSVDLGRLRQSADNFESKILPTDRRYFGEAWAPGPDGDEHLTVLNTTTPGAAGYYSISDEYSTAANPYSNQRKMIYMNVSELTPGSMAYDSTLAHELQHAIHWHMDPDEEGWVNEGCSVLAQVLNGYSSGGTEQAFLHDPDTQINTWSDQPGQNAVHYGASYLFMDYFYRRFGEEMLRDLVADRGKGIAGFNDVLARHGYTLHFDDVFQDWIVANVLDDPKLADGRYGYPDRDGRATIGETETAPTDVLSSTVRQYAADYIELKPGRAGDVTIVFTGTNEVKLTNNTPHSGRSEWWGNRADVLDTTLTRQFNLAGLTTATLTFWTWYDLEKDWDYAYVEVSGDNGRTWTTLPGRYTTTSNAVGNNLGNGWTGKSGGDPAQWVEERVDLTPYAGQTILLRFEYVTDDAVNLPGFCLDDIAIPELGYADDAETDGGWQANGFLRSNNTVPQRYAVQVIAFGEQTTVTPLPLDEWQRGSLTIAGWGGQVKQAILAVSALAPSTTELAPYEFAVVPATDH
jgi:immune inhibitor A